MKAAAAIDSTLNSIRTRDRKRRFFTLGFLAEHSGRTFFQIVDAIKRLGLDPAQTIDTTVYLDADQVGQVLNEIERIDGPQSA